MKPSADSSKKAYVAPKLVRLGSVRDLTFGVSGNVSDGTLKQVKSVEK